MENNQIESWKRKIGICVAAGLFGVIAVIYIQIFLAYRQEHGERRKVFGATYMTMNNQFYKVVNNEILRQIEKKGDHLITLDPALDQKKQNEQIKYLIEQKADAIFVNPVDWKGVKSGLQAAKAAGIPVIVIDTPVYDDELVDMTVVSDNYQAGVQCAKDMMKKRKSAKIVLLTHKETKSGVDRIQGFLDTIQVHGEYQVVAEADTQGQIERALPKVEKIIEGHQDIDVIMALNDPAAMGALAALDSKNCRDGVLVYGVDGSPEAKKLIKEGMMTGTSAQLPKQMADIALDSAYQLLAGKKVQKNRITSVEMVTEENIDQFDVNRW